MTLFERVFGGNDAVYGLTVSAVDNAIAQYGESQAVSFPDTAYALPCYFGVTGVKITTLGEMKAALDVIKSLMTRNNRLNDAFMSGVATALCAEFIEALKYLNGATPYEMPCYGHLADAVIRNLGVPLVTGDIPGVAVILGEAPSADEAVELVKSYQSQGIWSLWWAVSSISCRRRASRPATMSASFPWARMSLPLSMLSPWPCVPL